MQKSDNNHHHHHHSDTEIVGGNDRTSYSGPLSGPLSKRPAGKKSARFNIPGEASTSSAPANSNNDYVEITLDVRDDSVAVHSVKAADGGEVEDPELAALARGLKKKSSFGSSVRNASSRIRQVSEELKRLASITRRPHPARGRFDRTTSATAHALKGLKFISKKDGSDDWNTVEEKFRELTKDTKGLLPPEKFGECLGMNAEFAGKLFDALNRRSYYIINVESINKEQLKRYWEQISDQSFDTRLQIFFDMADKDADGRIAEEEVTEIIALSASANKLKIIQVKAGEYARMIMEELDPDGIGYIMIEDLEMLLLQGPSQSVRGERESRNLSMMLSESLKPTRDNVVKRWYRDLNYFVIDNWQRIWVMALWIGVMAALFTYKYVQYKNREVFEVMGHCVCFAKGAGETLKLNMALVLLPVCRNTITWLRNKTRLGVAVPFDDNLNFHKVIAMAIGMGVGIHAITHLACDFPRLLSATPDKYEPMEDFFGDQPMSYWWFIKGWEGVTGIVMVVLMAIAFTLATPLLRRGNIKLPKRLEPLNNLIKLAGFNAFWYSHHLFVIVYACLIIHGIKLYLTKEWYKKTTWMYLAIPLALYASERMIRVFRSSIKPVQLLKVAKYPANVLTLHMSKPDGFKYKSGQYIFVNCAKVSPFQWHPFSITSAPKDDYVSVHIRQFGDWTTDLHDVFEKFRSEQDPDTGKSGPFRADYLRGENNPDLPKVKIDGPYGAPTQDYKSYDVVLLVGLGIGATPMISVVKDIINNIKAKEEEEEEEEEEEHALEEWQGPSPLTKPKRSTGLINVVKDIINNMMKAKEEEEHTLEEGQGPSPLTKPKRSKGSASGSHNFKTQKAYFYWMTREQGSFDWFKGVMNDVAEMDNNEVIEMHNYCTSVYEEGDARSALITMLQSLNHAKNGVDVVSGTRVKSHFAKPNWRAVYKRIALNHPNKRVGVFYCGAPPPVKELRHLASDFSHKTNTKFEFHKENF